VLIELTQRPLFNPKRQPIQPAAEKKPPPPPPPPPQIAFIGTMSQDGEQLAMVKTSATPLAFSVKVGNALDGWQVSDISPERIVLSNNATKYEVKLNQAPPPGASNTVRPVRTARTRGNQAASNAAPQPIASAPIQSRSRFRGIR
jgi:hypothetical protein